MTTENLKNPEGPYTFQRGIDEGVIVNLSERFPTTTQQWLSVPAYCTGYVWGLLDALTKHSNETSPEYWVDKMLWSVGHQETRRISDSKVEFQMDLDDEQFFELRAQVGFDDQKNSLVCFYIPEEVEGE